MKLTSFRRCEECDAPLLSVDEKLLRLCRDCDRTDEELMLDYIEHLESQVEELR